MDQTDIPACPPGYRLVEEIEYREVCRKVCRAVPDKKKVTHPVYACKTEDYCLPRCHGPLCCGKDHACAGGADSCCPHCGRPRTRKVLLKKIVTEECPRYKCVVETVVERVPCKVYRLVPCQSPPPMPAPE